MSQEFGDFFTRFPKIAGTVWPDEARRGLAKAAAALLRDAIRETPTVPLDQGTLRGSGSAFVGQKHLINSPHKTAEDNPADSTAGLDVDDSNTGTIEAIVGFNQPQAAWLHENPDLNFSEPGSGAKYIESKIVSRRDHYMALVAGTIRGGGR